jgi:tetratricopeptide (TPR) repeat protein
MYCKNCGHRTIDPAKTACEKCGTLFTQENSIKQEPVAEAEVAAGASKAGKIRKIIGFIFILGIIGWNIYASLDESAIDKNNDALAAYQSGDTDQAIAQFKQAVNEAVTTQTKIDTRINLTYAYISVGRVEEALAVLRDALTFTEKDSFYFHLINGEIALIEDKADLALAEYSKAYEQKPDDFQINTALTLFYIDMENMHPALVDYAKALIHAKKAYEADDKSVLTTKNLAAVQYFNGNYSETITLFTSVDINNEPLNQFILGMAYAQIGNDVNAKRYLRLAMEGGMELPQDIKEYVEAK